MIIYPAIDLYDGKAVRLLKGDYDNMTIYSECPPLIAEDFVRSGAPHIHVVDLEGAKDGTTPNFETVCAIKEAADKAASLQGTSAFVEIGGGIRDEATVAKYLDAGIDRVILGTAAVSDPAFLEAVVRAHGEKIAVGIDVKGGYVAVKGWTELSDRRLDEFAGMMQEIGVKTIICTDISRDGAMKGANHDMYRELSEALDINIVASGGVSSLEDVKALADMGIHGAIIGKAYYTGAIDLKDAVRIGGEQK